MVAVSNARGGEDSLVLDSFVHYASPEMKNVVRANYDPESEDLLHHIEELVHFEQSIELGSGAVRCEVVDAHVDVNQKERSICFGCGKVGYVQADHRSGGKGGSGKMNDNGMLTAEAEWFQR
uniref:Uncharacterized protein n=1 Tax=Peronospora matthiolae TaxID=2874970 RepID=A0AAV1VDS6_9STRA